MTDPLQPEFARDGYTTVRSVLTLAQVAGLREVLIDAFDQPPSTSDDPLQRVDVASRYPEIRTVFRHPGLLSVLRAILGEHLFFLPDMVAHDSGFPPWHKDTTTMEKHGYSFHKDPAFLMVHVGLYLQNNGAYGGGLDAIPASHLVATDPFLRKPRTHIGQVFDYRVVERFRTRGSVSIPTSAGDALIFDFRLTHRATLPSACPRGAIPPEHRKLAIFLSCTGSAQIAQIYRDYMIARGGYEYLERHEYPDDFKKLAHEQDIVLVR